MQAKSTMVSVRAIVLLVFSALTLPASAQFGAVLSTEGDYVLNTGEYLTSPSGRYYLHMQADGNLVLYKGPDPTRSQGAIWSTGTQRQGGEFGLAMQRDGNLVIYHNGEAIWSSQTSRGVDQPFFLHVQDDGNLVIYEGTGPDNQGQAVWSSWTGSIRTPFDEAVGHIRSALGDDGPCARAFECAKWNKYVGTKDGLVLFMRTKYSAQQTIILAKAARLLEQNDLAVWLVQSTSAHDDRMASWLGQHADTVLKALDSISVAEVADELTARTILLNWVGIDYF